MARHLGVSAGEIGLTSIRTGKFNSSFIARVANQQWVVRVAPCRSSVFVFYEREMMRQEPGIHRRLLECTDIPVPRIDTFDDTHADLDRDYMIMQFLPGRPMSELSELDHDAVLGRVGECLKQAHAITAESYGYLGEHHPMTPQPSWNDAFWMMWRLLVEDIAGVGFYDGAESARMLALLDAHSDCFTRRVPPSLLHMDVWAQNILVEDACRLTGLLDWDRAVWGDPEIEFAVLDYCGISQPAFWEGYGQPRENSRETRVRTAFYLLYEIQKYIVIHAGRHRNRTSAQQYKSQVMDLAERLGRM